MTSDQESEQFADVREHVPFLARHERIADLLESILGYQKVRRMFAEADLEGEEVFRSVAQKMDLKIEIEGLAEKLPSDGPVVILSNHSHGGADALAMTALARELRPDLKMLANRQINRLPGVPSVVFPVSILESGNAGENAGSLRAMLKHVRGGGALGVFPAGRVAFWQGDRMKDPPWNEHIVRLLQRMDATILPVWFFGNPPPLINLLSRLSPFLRTALIPTGFTTMKGQTIRARAGDPFSTLELKAKGDDATRWMRKRLDSLAELGN